MNQRTAGVPPWIIDAGIAFAGSLLYCAAALLPVRHLVNGTYFLRFLAFSLGAGLAVFLALRALGPALRGPHSRPAAFVLCALSFSGLYLWNKRPPPNVILLVLDSLRADHLSCYGYERRTSPNLDRFAADALQFDTCISQSAGTDKSLPAILASIYPSMFYDPARDGDNFYLPSRFPLVSEYLKPLGYDTWGFSANPHISRAMNYDRGFDEFIEFWRRDCRPADLEAWFTEKVARSGQNRFLLAGLVIDPHTPYTPRPPFDVFSRDRSMDFEALKRIGIRTGFPAEVVERLRDLYDGEILEVDHALGLFLDWLKSHGRYDRSLILITADHGEAFKEHGVLGHGGVLYEERIHIPLLVRFPSPFRFPELRPRGRVPALVTQVDFLPTILGFLGAAPPGEPVQGRNLVPSIYGKEPWPEGDVFLEELVRMNAIRCIRGKEWKLIHARNLKNPGAETFYLYHIARDPLEKNNLHGRPETLAVEKALLAEILRRTEAARRYYGEKKEGTVPDRKTLEELERLGYGK